MKVWKAIALVSVAVLMMVGLVANAVHQSYKRDMKRFYKDGFRVGRVIGRDDVMLHLKRKDCFQQSLDSIVQDQDAPLVKTLEAQVDAAAAPTPQETAVPGTQGTKK